MQQTFLIMLNYVQPMW